MKKNWVTLTMGRVPSWSVGMVGALIALGGAAWQTMTIPSLDAKIAALEQDLEGATPKAVYTWPPPEGQSYTFGLVTSTINMMNMADNFVIDTKKLRLQQAKIKQSRAPFLAMTINLIGLLIVMLKDLPWWKQNVPPNEERSPTD